MSDSFHDGIGRDEIGYVEEIASINPLRDPDRPTWEGWSVAWSPDGAFVAYCIGLNLVKIAPWIKLKERQCKEITSADVLAVRRQSKEAHYIKLSDTTGAMARKRKPSGTDELVVDCGCQVRSLAFGCGTARTEPGSTQLNLRALRHVDDLVLATGLSNGRLRIWDASSGGCLWELMDHKDAIIHLKFNPTGNLHLASCSNDGTVKMWDLKDDGNMYKTLKPNRQGQYIANACAWSPNGTQLAAVGSHKTAVVWNMETYEIALKLVGHNHDVSDCDYSPDGALLATSSHDTTMIVWDAHNGDKLRVFCHLFPTPHPILAGGANGHYVRSLSFSYDGQHIASACDDGFIRYWSLMKDLVPVKLSNVEARFCVYSPNGEVLAAVSSQGEVTFHESPMSVNELKGICRMAVRSNLPAEGIDKLDIPVRHKEYLKYHQEL